MGPYEGCCEHVPQGSLCGKLDIFKHVALIRFRPAIRFVQDICVLDSYIILDPHCCPLMSLSALNQSALESACPQWHPLALLGGCPKWINLASVFVHIRYLSIDMPAYCTTDMSIITFFFFGG